MCWAVEQYCRKGGIDKDGKCGSWKQFQSQMRKEYANYVPEWARNKKGPEDGPDPVLDLNLNIIYYM